MAQKCLDEFEREGKHSATHFLRTSAAMGTVELTGLEMMLTKACGQYLATPSASVLTMPAAVRQTDSEVSVSSARALHVQQHP